MNQADFEKKNMCYFDFFKILGLLALLLLTSSCTNSPSLPISIDIFDDEDFEKAEFLFVSEKDANPDLTGRASPVVVVLYQLINNEKFQSSDARSLVRNGEKLLGAELRHRQLFTLYPGKKTEPKIKIFKETQYIAVLGAFQDIDNAIAKVVVPIDSDDPDDFCVVVSGKTLKVKKECQ